MLSRVADSLFWMARYLERAENTARVLNVHLNLMLEQPPEASIGRWARVRRTLAMEKVESELFDDVSIVVPSMAFDPANRSSIVSSIMSARDNARQVREQISSEMWEQLNRLFHEVRRADHADPYETEPIDFLNAVKEGSHLFQGLTDSTMSHGEGWHFIQIGRFLERAINTAALVEEHFKEFTGPRLVSPDTGPDTADYLEWIGLLKCATAFEAYCKAYSAIIVPKHVVEFLLLNAEFPHSLRFAVDQLNRAISAVAEAAPGRRSARLLRLSGRLKASLDFGQAEEILNAGLEPFLDEFRKQAGAIYGSIYQAYIRYSVETDLPA